MMNTKTNPLLPEHERKRYEPVGECIYCGAQEDLTNEHIIPFAAGGRFELPAASCKVCAAITGAFEGDVMRTMLGPLRMLYNMPSRRKKGRPKKLPLKVKYSTSTDWEIAHVDRSICPFLVGLPLYPMPEAITGITLDGDRGASTSNIWIRGAGFWRNKEDHLQWICNMLGAKEVMPTATVHTETFCLMLAKIAHSFVVAEVGLRRFRPFLNEIIRFRDLSNRAYVIGGGKGDELASEKLHELSLEAPNKSNPDLIVVRIRVLAAFGTPTYFVAAGFRSERTPLSY